jgi:HemY protein
MIRVLLYLIAVGLAAYGVAALADQSGDVVITWHGLRVETSLMVLGAAMLAVMIVIAMAWALVRALIRSPVVLARLLRNRRGMRAYEAISNGLIAVGAGDIAAARRFTAEVIRLAPGEPLALLLTAQSAQLGGDREAAERAFRAMASRNDTKALGLHGLYIEARRRDDLASATAFAEEAARTAPSLGWANKAVLEFRCAAGDWTGALDLLEQNKQTLDRATYRRQRAVLLTARARAREDSDRGGAKSDILEALQLAPTLTPTAALAGRLLAEGGETRKAGRVIEKAWRASPHPELAQAYIELRSGESALDRLKRIETLARRTPGHVEAALAVARAAIDAQEFAKARDVLDSYLAAPTRRVALLMARLERAERNDEGRAREWMARALNAAPDPAWTADGYVSDSWLPVSPVTRRLDAFEWRVPLAGKLTTPVIELESPGVSINSATSAQPISPVSPMSPLSPMPRAEVGIVPQRTERSPEPAPSPMPKPAPIIPIVHAPDDPGPDGDDNAEIDPDNGTWRNMLG